MLGVVMRIVLMIIVIFIKIFAQNFYYEGDRKVELTPILSARSNIKMKSTTNNIRWYKNDMGQTVGVTDYILVGWKDTSGVMSLLDSLNITVVEKITGDIWKLKAEGKNIFYLSQVLYQNPKTNFAHPNMVRDVRTR